MRPTEFNPWQSHLAFWAYQDCFQREESDVTPKNYWICTPKQTKKMKHFQQYGLVGKAIIYYVIRLLTRITISELRLELILVSTVIRKAVCTESDSTGCIVKPTFCFICYGQGKISTCVISCAAVFTPPVTFSFFSTFYQI